MSSLCRRLRGLLLSVSTSLTSRTISRSAVAVNAMTRMTLASLPTKLGLEKDLPAANALASDGDEVGSGKLAYPSSRCRSPRRCMKCFLDIADNLRLCGGGESVVRSVRIFIMTHVDTAGKVMAVNGMCVSVTMAKTGGAFGAKCDKTA